VLTVRTPFHVCRVRRVEGGNERVRRHVPHLDAAAQVPKASHHQDAALRIEQRQILQQRGIFCVSVFLTLKELLWPLIVNKRLPGLWIWIQVSIEPCSFELMKVKCIQIQVLKLHFNS
jgi:hypothetical protein